MVAAGAVVAPGTVVRSGEIWGGEVACLLLALQLRIALPCSSVRSGGKASRRSSQEQPARGGCPAHGSADPAACSPSRCSAALASISPPLQATLLCSCAS